jgi:hypothetical protein
MDLNFKPVLVFLGATFWFLGIKIASFGAFPDALKYGSDSTTVFPTPLINIKETYIETF